MVIVESRILDHLKQSMIMLLSLGLNRHYVVALQQIYFSNYIFPQAYV